MHWLKHPNTKSWKGRLFLGGLLGLGLLGLWGVLSYGKYWFPSTDQPQHPTSTHEKRETQSEVPALGIPVKKVTTKITETETTVEELRQYPDGVQGQPSALNEAPETAQGHGTQDDTTDAAQPDLDPQYLGVPSREGWYPKAGPYEIDRSLSNRPQKRAATPQQPGNAQRSTRKTEDRETQKAALRKDGKVKALAPVQGVNPVKENGSSSTAIIPTEPTTAKPGIVPTTPNTSKSDLARQFGQGVGEGLIKGAIEGLMGGGGASGSGTEVNGPSVVDGPTAGKGPGGGSAQPRDVTQPPIQGGGDAPQETRDPASGQEVQLSVFQSCMKEFANSLGPDNIENKEISKKMQKQVQERCAVEQLLSE